MVTRNSLLGRILCSPIAAAIAAGIIGYFSIGGAGLIFGTVAGFIFMKALTD